MSLGSGLRVSDMTAIAPTPSEFNMLKKLRPPTLLVVENIPYGRLLNEKWEVALTFMKDIFL